MVSGESMANHTALSDDHIILKGELTSASGELLANDIALNDDLQVTGEYLLSLIGGDV